MKPIVWQEQPTRASCGQTCVAMVLGIPATQVLCMIPGGACGTTSKDLRLVLRAHGYVTSERLIPLRGKPPPELAILKVIDCDPRKWHWVLHAEGTYYDPDLGAHQGDRVPYGRATSALIIEPRPCR